MRTSKSTPLIAISIGVFLWYHVVPRASAQFNFFGTSDPAATHAVLQKEYGSLEALITQKRDCERRIKDLDSEIVSLRGSLRGSGFTRSFPSAEEFRQDRERRNGIMEEINKKFDEIRIIRKQIQVLESDERRWVDVQKRLNTKEPGCPRIEAQRVTRASVTRHLSFR